MARLRATAVTRTDVAIDPAAAAWPSSGPQLPVPPYTGLADSEKYEPSESALAEQA